jgi:hypothetical protein
MAYITPPEARPYKPSSAAELSMPLCKIRKSGAIAPSEVVGWGPVVVS